MIYGSVCSGIEAATMAWHPLGWTPAFFSEIEKFPSAVLAHHYGSNMPGEAASTNGVPNLGDMTKFQEWPDAAIDVLVGGTPCQSFSVAGLRAGLADPRGNLMLTYLAIAAKYQPRWLVWENVPGVLSSNGGRDFGTFLGGLGECGYGFAYRVLDAQFCRTHGHDRAVPQRRRRVFVVGYLGDWRRAAAVLFDGTSLRGNPPPRREAGQRVAPTISARTKGGGGLGTDFDLDGGLISSTGNVAHCLNAGGMGRQDFETETMVAHTLRGEGFDASEDGTGKGIPLVPEGRAPSGWRPSEQLCRELGAHLSLVPHQGAPSARLLLGLWRTSEGLGLLREALSALQKAWGPVAGEEEPAQPAWAVRRLTPKECARLQGFPDDYLSSVIWRGKSPADGPMYKALGNSMAVNVMRVIGERIAMVDAL